MEKTKADYFIGDYVSEIRKSDRYQKIIAPSLFTGDRPDFILFNNEVKVYSPDLMYIFLSSDCVEILNRDSQEIEKIKPLDLYKIYSDGYKRGESDFINDYGLTKKQLFSINTDIFVQDVKDQYYNVRTPFGGGLVSLKNRNLIAFKLDDFEVLGYYCGLLSGLEELVKGNPTLFADFYNNSLTGEASQHGLSENEEAPTSKAPTASTNKKIDLNEKEFKSYFKAQFKGMGNGNINHYSTLISEIGNTDFHKKEHGQIALMIYESGFLNDRKPKTFTKWYDIFCDFVGIERRAYEKNKLTNPPERIKKLFSYLS